MRHVARMVDVKMHAEFLAGNRENNEDGKGEWGMQKIQ